MEDQNLDVRNGFFSFLLFAKKLVVSSGKNLPTKGKRKKSLPSMGLTSVNFYPNGIRGEEGEPLGL